MKSHIVWHLLSAVIAIGSATAAYFSYVAAQEQREVAREAQEALQASIQDGEIDPISINIAITNLSEVTGIEALTLPEPEIEGSASDRDDGRTEAVGSETGIMTNAGPLEVRLRNIRSRFGESKITLTTDFVNTSSEKVYIGTMTRSSDRVATSDTGQRMSLNALEGVTRYSNDPERNTLLLPQETVSVEWIVYADENAVERGLLTVRQNFSVVSPTGEVEQVTVQLRDIPLVQTSG